ncbi:pore-forming ESAT-6 family protein [Niallia sp. XMNu-256]|uniref:pore-forming ESAT-6 family protein n=1 Tax=Niallia sp. XMNu-256 TaxID=3082444 RepID=UPI0030D11EE9
MAAEGINISLAEVTKTAQTIRTLNQSLSEKLTEIKKEMNNLQQPWQSDASNTIREKFNALAPKFDNYEQVINSYATFLDTTVQRYNEAETAINNNASQFK